MKIEIKNISYSYDTKDEKILSDFSLELNGDERVGLIAPSGYGKTTLCKILAGYIKPDEGDVLYDGVSISKIKGYSPIQMVWQQPEFAVDPRLRMKETINEGDNIEDRLITGLGIEKDWFNRFPTELSGGELQRFNIARSLGRRTKFLICDEITTMLDLITQSQIWNFILEEVKMRKIGLIAVSHNSELMKLICTKQINLVTGKYI